MRWPDGFNWGTGASSTQCEGAAPASNWIDWERAGRAPRSGAGNGFADRYAEDFALYASLGLKHQRLSIEWARIEPDEGVRAADAVDHYRDVLRAARDAGIEPWVCLHHFTLPRWFTDRGGFALESNRKGAWANHVEFLAQTYGDLVSGWKPVNEPIWFAAGGWLGGGMPPGVRDFHEFAAVLEAVLLASHEAAKRLRQSGAPTATIHGLAPVYAVGEDATERARRWDDVVWQSWLSLVRDGVLRVPSRDPVERPDLADAFDLIGFSYYSAHGVDAHGAVPYPSDAPVSPLGYAICADGLGEVLDRLHAELPDQPLLISEYGIGTDDDREREAYLERGLQIAADAIARGVDLRGFFHWTGVDNYEWLHGYGVRFGIADIGRRLRPSAGVLKREAMGPAVG
jgi:beta-glucosidase